MKSIAPLTLALTIALTFLVGDVRGQDCPSGMVCVPQETANRLYNIAEQLVAAKDVIIKMQSERGASDAALASALKTIEGWQSLDSINNTIIAKQKDVIALYEQTIKLYASLVENLEKRLSKPKSAWSRFVDVLKNAAILLAGVSLGRGI